MASIKWRTNIVAAVSKDLTDKTKTILLYIIGFKHYLIHYFINILKANGWKNQRGKFHPKKSILTPYF